MARPRNVTPSLRIRLDGYERQPIVDARTQLAVDWVSAHKRDRRAFPVAWELLKAALNGELGGRVQQAVAAGDTEQAMDALHDLLGAFDG